MGNADVAEWQSVAIENLFEIQGWIEHRFPSSSSQEGGRRCAPLVEGGGLNGVGVAKALLLLFGGTASAVVRRVGFPPRLLSVEEFVLGLPGVWHGMIGPATRVREPTGTGRVVAEIEIDGMPIVVERRWAYDGSTFEETIMVDGTNFPSDVDVRLAQLLPVAAAPLFLSSGGTVRDICDHPGHSRSAIDFLSRQPFLRALLRALGGSGSSDVASCTPRVECFASSSRSTSYDVQASQTSGRERVLRDLRATTQELERLAEALELESDTTTPDLALPDRLARRHRAWLDRSKPPALLDRNAAMLDDLGRMPEASVARGTGWAELRFIEVQASVGRLKHRLSEFPAASGTDPPPDELAIFAAGDVIGGRPANERLIDCMTEFAESVRARRVFQVAERLQRHALFVQLTVDGSLSLTKPDGRCASRPEFDADSRGIIGFALVEAFAHLSGIRLPVVLDDAFDHVSNDTRDLAVTMFFGGWDG